MYGFISIPNYSIFPSGDSYYHLQTGIKMTDALLNSPWFLHDGAGKWSTEIGLVPYFDFLNHTTPANAEWDFNAETGEIWVETADYVKV